MKPKIVCENALKALIIDGYRDLKSLSYAFKNIFDGTPLILRREKSLTLIGSATKARIYHSIYLSVSLNTYMLYIFLEISID